jgi:hypothetical protein
MLHRIVVVSLGAPAAGCYFLENIGLAGVLALG